MTWFYNVALLMLSIYLNDIAPMSSCILLLNGVIISAMMQQGRTFNNLTSTRDGGVASNTCGGAASGNTIVVLPFVPKSVGTL